MTLYTCTTCRRINAPKKGETELPECWTCGGAVVVVSDELPFDTAMPDRKGPGLKCPDNGFDSRVAAN